MKIAVAMSGGVDSSVAAALMCDIYGKENVFGVTAKLFCYAEKNQNEKACCSLGAISDARAVCEKLGIAHYVISEEKEFERAVIKNFIDAYRHGQTPIPCIPCNTQIKFGTMLEHVKKLGADKLATGHYARVEPLQTKGKKLKVKSVSGDILNTKFYILKRGLDPLKDQTYFLHGLSQEQLAFIEFPIGEMTKPEVRKIAEQFDLKTAKKGESQGVCFVSEGTVADWLADKIERKPGNIVDTKGNVVGKHDGIVLYTVGQRKRIGGGYDKPMFVVAIDSDKNEVVIGGVEDLYHKELICTNVHWINEPKLPLKCTAKIRYNMHDTKCVVKLQIPNFKEQTNFKIKNSDLNKNFKFQITNSVEVIFKEPQRAVTPGQSVVFYNEEQVLGGGIIAQ